MRCPGGSPARGSPGPQCSPTRGRSVGPSFLPGSRKQQIAFRVPVPAARDPRCSTPDRREPVSAAGQAVWLTPSFAGNNLGCSGGGDGEASTLERPRAARSRWPILASVPVHPGRGRCPTGDHGGLLLDARTGHHPELRGSPSALTAPSSTAMRHRLRVARPGHGGGTGRQQRAGLPGGGPGRTCPTRRPCRSVRRSVRARRC